MPEHPTDAHFSFTFVFKQALIVSVFSLFLCVVILVEGFKFNPFEGDRPQKESD